MVPVPTTAPSSGATSPHQPTAGIHIAGAGIVPIVALPGQPIAQIKPSATAIAGVYFNRTNTTTSGAQTSIGDP